MAVEEYSRLIRNIPDFPHPGILFRDITPLLNNAKTLSRVIRDMAAPFRGSGITQVVAVESRGFLLGVPIALELDAGFVPVRKAGKLPFLTYQVDYQLEYGSATVAIHQDGLSANDRVLMVDDVLATGGTMAASVQLVEQARAQVIGVALLIELTQLNGRSKLGGLPVFSVLQF